jgi:hypothetical protein
MITILLAVTESPLISDSPLHRWAEAWRSYETKMLHFQYTHAYDYLISVLWLPVNFFSLWLCICASAVAEIWTKNFYWNKAIFNWTSKRLLQLHLVHHSYLKNKGMRFICSFPLLTFEWYIKYQLVYVWFFVVYTKILTSRGSWVSVVTDWTARVRFQEWAEDFSLSIHIQTSSRTHPTSYPMGTRGPFPGGKVARAWSWPLTHLCLVPRSRKSGATPLLPHTSPWRGA